jgi:ubiquinone/menaquinone biosynthesis C-methylase UbiE
MPEPALATIAEAFSRTAEKYDQFADDHPHLTRMRNKVYAHLTHFLQPGARILELNAGTGTDAVHLAQQGFHVHATDIAPGMLGRLTEKIERLGLHDRLTFQQCSFTDLASVTGGPFDAVFSDLGGLNCVADLSPVIAQLPAILRPGGTVTWVLMPRICLWELALVFTGQFRLATRRLAHAGTRAHLEGQYFQVYYFDPASIISKFASAYQLLALEGLSVITPTAESKNLARRFPRLYAALSWLDDRLSPLPPFSTWGDFYMLSMRYTP